MIHFKDGENIGHAREGRSWARKRREYYYLCVTGACTTTGSCSKGKNLPTMTPLMRVLLGMSEPSEKVAAQDLKFFDGTLNPSQRDAVRFALESPEVACIHGPPG